VTPRQSTTLAEALSGRIPVLLLVLEDGSVCVIAGDRARAERVAVERRAVVVECGPVTRERLPGEPHSCVPHNAADVPANRPETRANP
jgi:hypothetical protein